MGFFTRTAMDALMKTSHPEINRRQCWNLHPHRKPCTTCKDICPYGEEIFSRPNLVKDWDPCTDCGLCVSACRSGCIAPSPEQVQRDTAAADSDSDTIWIGCEKSARKNTVVRSCICALSWEALAYLALNKKIVLDLTPCGQCENDLCAEQLRKELTRLVDFFGQPMFEARFSLAYDENEYAYHVQELTRREMLLQVSDGGISGSKKLLQIPVAMLFRAFTTTCNTLAAMFPSTDNLIIRLLMCWIATVFVAIGIFFYVPADIMPLAGEGAMLAISTLTGKPFPTVKIAFDVSMVIISLSTCLIFLHGLGSVGIGTVIAALLVGIELRMITHRFGRWRDKLLGK